LYCNNLLFQELETTTMAREEEEEEVSDVVGLDSGSDSDV